MTCVLCGGGVTFDSVPLLRLVHGGTIERVEACADCREKAHRKGLKRPAWNPQVICLCGEVAVRLSWVDWQVLPIAAKCRACMTESEREWFDEILKQPPVTPCPTN